MNATEARALSEARATESYADYMLRTKIYPDIQSRAEAGGYKAASWGLWGNKNENLMNSIAERLRAQGFEVSAWVDECLGPMVEVKW